MHVLRENVGEKALHFVCVHAYISIYVNSFVFIVQYHLFKLILMLLSNMF